MKHLGLFEGIGGFSLAARWMGWETIAWCEWDEFCQKVLKYHFPEAEQYGDITKTDFARHAGQIDILTGGFPCQPYSSAGKRLGKEDDRHLWPEMLRAIREIKPRWVVGENVRGLTNWNGGLVFDEVQADLENEGYEVTPYLLPACAVNAPHRRDRIWFIAHAKKGNDRRTEREFCEKNGRQDSGVLSAPCSAGSWDGCERATPHATQTERKQPGGTWSGREGLADLYSGPFTSDAGDTRQQRGKQYGAPYKGKGREQPPRPTTEFHQIGNWQHFPTQPPVCGRNDGISSKLDGITFPKWREKSIGAYGNAIVPQVAYQIFKAIAQFENA